MITHAGGIMEFRQIQYFLKAAEYENITRASDELHIAQPALSKSIRLLEEDLNVKLFARDGNRIHLNEAGRIFYEYAQKISKESAEVRQELEGFRQTENATVIIHQDISFAVLFQAVIEFNRIYPSVNFKFYNSVYAEDQNGLTVGTVPDFEVYSTAVPENTSNSRTLLNERIQLGVPFNNPLSRREHIQLEEVRDMGFLFSSPIHTSINDIMHMHCQLNGFRPKHFMDVTSRDDVNYLLRNGLGVAFVPELTWYYMTHETGYKLVTIDSPECRRCINIRWKDRGYISKASLLFRDFVLDYVPGEIENICRRYSLPHLG